MNIFQRFLANLRYSIAVRKADEAHLLTGNRYYVMPSFGGRRQLIILDRKNFRGFKLKHYIDNDSRVIDMARECFYCTPYRNGGGFLRDDDRRRKYLSFLSWWEAERKLRRSRRRRRRP